MIRLSDHFTYRRLLRYTFPSIIMLVFTSVYGVVDGFFVSNFVGKTPFAAVNFIMPFLMILGCIGFMFGTGGQRPDLADPGAGPSPKGQRNFFADRLCLRFFGRHFCHIGLFSGGPRSLPYGSGGTAPCGQHSLWKNHPAGPALLCTAVRIPGPVCHRRKAQAGPCRYRSGGPCKHGLGCPVCGGFFLGTARRGRRYGLEPVHRRRIPACLL